MQCGHAEVATLKAAFHENVERKIRLGKIAVREGAVIVRATGKPRARLVDGIERFAFENLVVHVPGLSGHFSGGDKDYERQKNSQPVCRQAGSQFTAHYSKLKLLLKKSES